MCRVKPFLDSRRLGAAAPPSRQEQACILQNGYQIEYTCPDGQKKLTPLITACLCGRTGDGSKSVLAHQRELMGGQMLKRQGADTARVVWNDPYLAALYEIRNKGFDQFFDPEFPGEVLMTEAGEASTRVAARRVEMEQKRREQAQEGVSLGMPMLPNLA